MPGQFKQVAFALAQGGQLDRELRQTVVEVFAKAALADQLCQVAVGRRDDAHIDFVGIVGTQGPDFTLLQYAQQLGLQRQRHVTNFVQQQGAAAGRVKQPDTVTVGTRKCAFAVTKQLAFEQVFRERCAVLHNKGLAATGAAVVNGARNHFFAGTGFAQ